MKRIRTMILPAILVVAAAAASAAAQAPSWATGTFTGRNPQSGGTITLTIQQNGTVTANFDGAVRYGRYRNDRITIDGATSRVRRTNDGIRTVSTTDGETIDYTRGGYGGGDWNGSGNTSNPPSWARGTFYGRSPQDGSRIILTITNDGRVTANVGGSMIYGTYYRGDININGDTSRVSQISNGIRTTSNRNRETIDYSRTDFGSGPWNGGGGGNTSTPPSWARGTFYGRSPQDGSRIVLSINNNGRVTATIGNSTSYGTYYRDTININGNTSRVSRRGNGIRTVSTMNSETIDYGRTDVGGGGWDGGGNTSTPPSWARGTFYARSPQDGSQITLTINNNGRVTANVGGYVSYGTYYRDTITIDGNSSRVSRSGNGIRTISTSNGETIDYRRDRY